MSEGPITPIDYAELRIRELQARVSRLEAALREAREAVEALYRAPFRAVDGVTTIGKMMRGTVEDNRVRAALEEEDG